ncbi:MAG: RNA methyltransferase, partial [Thermoanaerobaculia bacterium]
AQEGLFQGPVAVLDAAGAAEPPRPEAGPGAASMTLVVGPEGGWSEEEHALFERSHLSLWSLGERVLRVETAAVVACGIVLASAGSR